MILRQAASQAQFQAAKMAKVTLDSGKHLYAGLNCFEAGQEHAAHVHGDQDKLYVVLEGEGTATLGDETSSVSAGDVILAAAGVSHGLRASVSSRLVVLVVFAPPPAGKSS